MKRWSALGAAALAAQAFAAPTTLQEGFDAVVPGGWLVVNASTPVGSTSWFQGNAGVFAAHAGASDSYAAANFLSTDPAGGLISTWLMSPVLEFGSQTLSFWARTDVDVGAIFGDGMRVLISTAGGSTALSDFVPLLDINAANAPGGFPQDWTQFTALLAAAGTGRIAFEYTVGRTAIANYVGLDSVSISIAIAEPAVLALVALAAGLAAGVARRRGSPSTEAQP
jgi:hypothetical protein